MEIMPGIHRLKVPIPDNPLENVNAYLVAGGAENALIDPGWPSREALESLMEQLAGLEMDLADVHMVVATHAHPDHIGLAGEIRRRTGARLCAHESMPAIEPGRFASVDFIDRMRAWLLSNGMPAGKMASMQRHTSFTTDFDWRVSPDRRLHDGETLRVGDQELEVVWTPGHSPDHICLYHRITKTLISGDHILPEITPSISLTPYNSALEDPLGTYLDSLGKVKDLDVDMVLPAHQSPFHDFQKRVSELFLHHDERLEDLLGSMGDEEKSAYEIALRMRWTGLDGEVMGKDLPPGQQPLAMGETLAHLEALIRGGRAIWRVKDGIRLFSARGSTQI